MFLWVDLMIRELSNKSRSSKIREALQAAPQGLNGMVQTVLNNYSLVFEDEDEAGDFNLILVWIVCAARPLYLAEIDQILNLRLSDEDKITGLEERLRFEWGILLDVNRTDGLTTGDLEGDPNRLYKAMDIFKIEDGKSQEFRDETEIETEFASDPKTTNVTFCHASIGDIFKYGAQGQGQVSAGDGHPLIGINMAEATMQTLKSCLELIHSSDQKNGFLRGYAIGNWFDHLKQAAKYAGDAKVDTQLRESCAALILNLFESEKILKEWLPDFSAENFNTANLNCLLVFIKECTTVDSIPSQSRDWAKSITERPIELFLPAAQLAAKQWLQGISWNTKLCTRIIYRVSSLQNGDLADDTPEVLPADVVLEAAERTGLEKNSEWHRRLAKSLRDLNYVEESQQHFETAIALDDQNWLAFAGLGRAKNLKGNIEEAQKLYKSSAEILESLLAADENDHELKAHLARSYEDIGETAYHLKDMTTAQIYFKKSMELSKDRFVAITNYLAVIPEDDTEEIIRVMKSLDVENPNSPGFTYLSALLYTREAFAGISVVYFKVASAFKSTGEIEWLQNAYRAAILSARHYQNFVMEFRLNLKIADLLSVYSEEEEKALQIWKAVLNFPATFLRSNTILKYEDNYVGKLYASHLLKRAYLSGQGTPETEKCIKELEDIAVAPDVLEREAPDWEWFILPMPSLILGVWKKFAGEHDEADALLRPYLRFTTSDVFNEDINGRVATDYITAKILIATGDEARATSLLQIFRGSELFYFQCYARCGAAHTHWTGAYSCKICLADLCDGCTEVLKSGKKLPINICGPDHSWVYIEGLETPPEKGKILYNGETIPIAQFYRGLRAEWKVE